MKALPVRYNKVDDVWEIHDLTIALARDTELAVCEKAYQHMAPRLLGLQPGPMKDEHRRRLALLRRGHVRQVMRPNVEVTLIDAPMPDNVKTPFSDLGASS